MDGTNATGAVLATCQAAAALKSKGAIVALAGSKAAKEVT